MYLFLFIYFLNKENTLWDGPWGLVGGPETSSAGAIYVLPY